MQKWPRLLFSLQFLTACLAGIKEILENKAKTERIDFREENIKEIRRFSLQGRTFQSLCREIVFSILIRFA